MTMTSAQTGLQPWGLVLRADDSGDAGHRGCAQAATRLRQPDVRGRVEKPLRDLNKSVDGVGGERGRSHIGVERGGGSYRRGGTDQGWGASGVGGLTDS
jgi:hypothetical protein